MYAIMENMVLGGLGNAVQLVQCLFRACCQALFNIGMAIQACNHRTEETEPGDSDL